MPYARLSLPVLDRDTEPYVRGRATAAIADVDKSPQQRTALGQHLEHVPIGPFHCVKHRLNMPPRYGLVEEIAHGIDEDHSRTLPSQRVTQTLGAQRQIETGFEWMTADASKSLREAFGVAVVAAGADLRTTRHRVPGRVGPFNRS